MSERRYVANKCEIHTLVCLSFVNELPPAPAVADEEGEEDDGVAGVLEDQIPVDEDVAGEVWDLSSSDEEAVPIQRPRVPRVPRDRVLPRPGVPRPPPPLGAGEAGSAGAPSPPPRATR